MRSTPRWLCNSAASASSKLHAALQSLSVGTSPLSTRDARQQPTLETVCDALRDFGEDPQVATLGLRWMTQLDAEEVDSRTIAQGVGLTALLRVMQTHKNAQQMLAVREQCCRAVANVCMLCASEGSAAQPTASSTDPPVSSNYADLLVDGNAVEMVLGVMTEGPRLSLSGKQRVAMALNNLLMFSRDGAHRAVAADGESVAATFVHDVCETAASTSGSASEDENVAALMGASNATDAALAALVRMATLPAPDNAAGVQYRYQLVQYNVLEAVTAALLAHALLVSAAPHLAVAALPVFHKCWELLSLVASHAPNHVLLFEALFEAALRRKGGEAVLASVIAACPPVDVLRWMQRGSSSSGDGSVSDMQRKVHDSFVACLTDLTASRKDLKHGGSAPSQDAASSASEASAVIPTEAALGALESIASGAVSRWSVQILASCARYVDTIAQQGHGTTTTHHAVVHLAQRHVALVSNLAEDDPFVASENTMAVLDSFLASYLTMAHATSPAGVASSAADALEGATWMLPIVGQCFSCLWNILNTTHGRHALTSTGMSKSVREIVALADRFNNTAGSDGATAASTGASQGGGDAAASSSASPTAEEEAATRHSPAALMRQLSSIGKKLVEKLDATVDAPEYVHSPVTRRAATS